MKIKVGDPAPAFNIKNQEGKTVRLQDFKTQKVVLYFYPKDMTPGCTTEACDFQENLARLKKKNAVVVGVSFDDEKRHQKFREKYNLQFDLLVDADKGLAMAYGVYQKKKFMGKEFMGIVRSTVLIDEKGKVAKIWSPVKVKGHVTEILEML